ncbi:MAG: protein kinase, partial [Candidatus Hydrogenedentes bacterium]|nr:protein kinase [Candidatus Hydrogenedentota bacterium]
MPEAAMPKKLGRYEIVRELGKGAMGVVYEGRDPNIGRRVAIKTARRDVIQASGMGEELMERFLREAQAAGALNHPNIITIYDADEEDGIAYIAMEYLEGGDLRTIFERRNRMEVHELVDVAACICEALAVAHDAGIVHRDIKPANILIPKGGGLKIADFGIAHTSDSSLTQDGAMIGTPHYMSPEQFMGQKVTPQSDLFSVAIILYELLTGEKPFTGGQLNTIMHSVVKVDPIPPRELNFAVPEALSEVVMKALKKSPYERYCDGRSMACALRESVKPNPNPDLTLTSRTVHSSATVTMGAGTAPVDPGGMRTQPPEDAPTRVQSPSQLAAAADLAVSSGVTMPSQAVSAAAATGSGAVSATTPPVAPVPVGSTVSTGQPPGLLRSRAIIIGGGVLALVLLVAVALSLGGGGDTPSVPVENTQAALPEKYFSTFSLDIGRFPDQNAADEYNAAPDPESLNEKGEWLLAHHLVIYDASVDPEAVIQDIAQYKGGTPVRF